MTVALYEKYTDLRDNSEHIAQLLLGLLIRFQSENIFRANFISFFQCSVDVHLSEFSFETVVTLYTKTLIKCK